MDLYSQIFEDNNGVIYKTMILFIILITLITITIILYTIYKNYYNVDSNKEKQEKQQIPKVIYQTWRTKTLPTNMRKCVEKIKDANPNYKHYIYDDNECREFIKEHFNDNVVNAFDKLKPGAYKADLWRYCVLYINGGIYLDIKYQPINGFSFNYLNPNKEYFVLERPGFWENNHYGIYNAMMICKPKNETLLHCIRHIVENVKNNYYGINSLYPTGPGLLGKMYFNPLSISQQMKELEMRYDCDKYDWILYKNKAIFKNYQEYRLEQKKHSTNQYYEFLWRKKQIYNL